MTNKKLGIIGLGSFGLFMARILQPHFKIVGIDQKVTELPSYVTKGSLEDIVACDVIVIATPVQELDNVLQTLATMTIPNNKLILDVCSIKILPERLFRERLGHLNVNTVGLHPLFGPQSCPDDNVKGQRIAVTFYRSESLVFYHLLDFLENKLGLTVITVSAEQHDKEMALSQAVTHFIGKAITEMNKSMSIKLKTKTFDNLLNTSQIVAGNSQELTLAIQSLNPYAYDARQDLLGYMTDLDDHYTKAELNYIEKEE